jgi:hypothetical protein
MEGNTIFDILVKFLFIDEIAVPTTFASAAAP